MDALDMVKETFVGYRPQMPLPSQQRRGFPWPEFHYPDFLKGIKTARSSPTKLKHGFITPTS